MVSGLLRFLLNPSLPEPAAFIVAAFDAERPLVRITQPLRGPLTGTAPCSHNTGVARMATLRAFGQGTECLGGGDSLEGDTARPQDVDDAPSRVLGEGGSLPEAVAKVLAKVLAYEHVFEGVG